MLRLGCLDRARLYIRYIYDAAVGFTWNTVSNSLNVPKVRSRAPRLAVEAKSELRANIGGGLLEACVRSTRAKYVVSCAAIEPRMREKHVSRC